MTELLLTKRYMPTTNPEEGSPAQTPSRSRRRTWIAGGVAVAVLVGGGIAAVVQLGGPVILPGSCIVQGQGQGDAHVRLAPEQASIASTIGAVTVERKLTQRAATIAIGTGMQESKLRNLAHGDRDSLGVFQQRPSQGWGSPKQLQDPVYATRAFYDKLVQIKGYKTRPLTEVAQDVQRSGFPDAYAQHETEAITLAEAFIGITPHAVTCKLSNRSTVTPAPTIAAELDRAFGTSSETHGGVVSTKTQTTQGAAAIAAWGVAHADAYGITSVSHAGRTWKRTEATWEDDPEGGGQKQSTVIRTTG
ncbi:hypothetical protein [Dermatophilus congolensis]|nr:hypothetical protein [Dermatophilus congolensis]